MADAVGQVRAAERRASDRLARRMLRSKSATRDYGPPILDEDPPADDPCTLWWLTDGRLRGRPNGTIVEFAPVVTPGSSTSATPGPADPGVTEHTTEYAATWARGFCALHGAENTAALYFGDAPNHDDIRVMIGLPAATIATDLTGATIQQVELRAQNLDSWDEAGVEIRWGAHAEAAAPSTYSAVRADVYRDIWPKVGYGGDVDGWHQVDNTWLGRALQAGEIAGLTIDQPAGLTYWGRIDWSTVRIAITFAV